MTRRPSCLSAFRRRRRARVALGSEPLDSAAETYARNLFVGTALRRLDRATLNLLEDTAFAQAWAAEQGRCPRCPKESLQGDHIRWHLREWLLANGEPVPPAAAREPVRRNLRFVAELLGLSKDEAAVLRFLLALHRSYRLQEVAHSLGELSLPDAARAVAAAPRLPLARAIACFGSASRILRTGLVTVDPDAQRLVSKLQVKSQLLDAVCLPRLDRETFLHTFLDKAPPPMLTRGDFPDAAAFDLALRLVREAARTGARGVNLLLHGETGVGKTQLALLLGKELGVEVLAIGKADQYGDPALPNDRLASLRLALQLAPRQSLLLFDELEDLFRWDLDRAVHSRAAPVMSKQWFGALLEENEVPIVWCTNRIDGIDPAFLRRFAYAIELKSPGARQRAKVLARHLGEDSPLAPADVEAIAQRFEVSPGQLATAVRGARLVAEGGVPDRSTIERLLAPVHKAITGQDATLRPVFDPLAFDLGALRCSEDLAAIGDEVARFTPGPDPGLSFCLYGPPGTGKSEFVKYLAWRAGRPLVYRRVSDLVSCWVGQTERNIAAAFEEARQDGAVLLFDEADSFLRDRRTAVHSWEATLVNEFLQQLEVFPGIVACTTNLWQDLDQAALRRFAFKLEFLHPTPEQSAALFRTFFPAAYEAAGTDAVLAAMRDLPALAPGDFAAVARRLRSARASRAFDDLVRLLEGEAGVRRSSTPRAAGFRA